MVCMHFHGSSQGSPHYDIRNVPNFVILGILLFTEELRGKKICIHTDNKDLESVINKKTSTDKKVMPLVRRLVLTNLKNNTLVHVKWVKGLENGVADALSRGKFQVFRALAPDMEEQQTVIPQQWAPEQMLSYLQN